MYKILFLFLLLLFSNSLFAESVILNPGRILNSGKFLLISDRDESESGIFVYSKSNKFIDFMPLDEVRDCIVNKDYLYILSRNSLVTVQIGPNGKLKRLSVVAAVFKGSSLAGRENTGYKEQNLKLGDDLEFGTFVTFAGKRSFYTKAINPSLMTISRNKLYILNQKEIVSFSIDDPVNPALEKKIALKKKAYSIIHHEGTIYIRFFRGISSITLSRLQVRDISAWKHIRYFYPMTFYKDYAFIAMAPKKGGKGEVRAYSIEEVNKGDSNPISSIQVDTPGSLAVYHGYLFIGSGSKGMKIYHFDGYNLNDYTTLFMNKEDALKGYEHHKYRQDDGADQIPNTYFSVLQLGDRLVVNAYYGLYHYNLKSIDNYKLPFLGKIPVTR